MGGLDDLLDVLRLLDGLDDLHHVLVGEDVVPADAHGLELGAGAPHHGVLQLVDDRAVDLVTEVLHGAPGHHMQAQSQSQPQSQSHRVTESQSHSGLTCRTGWRG